MKRIGILALYDQDGIIDKSEELLLSSLPEILDRLIIVVNGRITDESHQILKKYSKEIIHRFNEGFDGGAYRDVFLHYLSKEELDIFDELLLVNNTFYGPFYPWSQLFAQMEPLQADFWGLTKYPAVFNNHLQMLVTEHVQSYFLLFRKKLFTDDLFFHFWKTMKHAATPDEATKYFEIPLTRFFSDAGFNYKVYTDLFPNLKYLEKKESIFTSHCYDLLKDCNFPILKKKNGMSATNPQTIPAIEFIQNTYHYDIAVLWENALRTLERAKLFESITDFYGKHERIFIYGCGEVGQAIKNFFDYNKWQVGGFLETTPQRKTKDGISITAWKEFQIEEGEGTGIIIALGGKNTEEVRKFMPRSEAIMYLY